MKTLLALGCVLTLLNGGAFAAEKSAGKKKTCCEEAAANKKECQNKCCIAAHKQGKSCEKCNPNKEDLKFIKDKAAKK